MTTETTQQEPVRVEVQRVEPSAMQRAAPAPLPLLGESFDELHRQAKALAPSTLIPKHLRGPDQATTLANVTIVLAYGRELGVGPIAALGGIAVVNGRPFAESQLLAGVVRNSGQCLYLRRLEATPASVTWETHRVGDPAPERRTFTWQDAVKCGYDKKDTYQQHPVRMLSARALGWLCRDVYPDVCKGLGTEAERIDYEQEVLGPPPAPKSGGELLRERIVRANPQLAPPPPATPEPDEEEAAAIRAQEQALAEPGSAG